MAPAKKTNKEHLCMGHPRGRGIVDKSCFYTRRYF
jgi:hypothetical protein